MVYQLWIIKLLFCFKKLRFVGVGYFGQMHNIFGKQLRKGPQMEHAPEDKEKHHIRQ